LKQLLDEHGISYKEELVATLSVSKKENSFCPESLSAMRRLSPQQKITLFRDLFKSRENVFARRWFSTKTGKSGYQPVCQHEWNRQYCDKRKYKCADCPNRLFLPLTNKDIDRHLRGRDEHGRDIIGVYAILEDDTCYFLCSDFDDKNCVHGYHNDVRAFTNVCKDWGIPYSIERSRSGNGAHVWIIFKEPIPAGKARKLGYTILTEAMNRDGRLSFKSYDRFFPNQDHLPEGGFGNLVALPLQGAARRKGNSVFVDENFDPYPDQWEYLLSVGKVPITLVDKLLMEHAGKSDFGALSTTSEAKPWEAPIPTPMSKGDMPSELTIIRSNMLYISLKELSPKVINHLKRIASFKNPEFFAHLGMRLPIYNIPRIISCAEFTDDYLALPRGCENAVTEFFCSNMVNVAIDDKTNHGEKIEISFVGILREEQKKAVRQLMTNNTGVLSATTAFGKTVTAIGLIANRKVNTLILVHNRALLNQWKKQLQTFLQIESTVSEEHLHKHGRKKPFSPIGCLFSGEDSLHGIIDIALMQSCVSDNEVKPFVRNYGMVIVDECHHVSAVNFEKILKYANAQYVCGLTATPMRKDGHQPIIFMQCGPIRYVADAKEQMAKQNFRRILIPCFTAFRHLADEHQTYNQILQELAVDKLRNQQIVGDIITSLKEGRTPIVISRLVKHVNILSELLHPFCNNIVVLVGSASAKKKRETREQLQRIPASEPMIIVATVSYIGEGFDFPRLDTLFMTLPMSYKGIVAQYTGRLHRDYKGKKEVRVYDYVDIRIPICDTMYKRRLIGYSAVGYQVRASVTENNDNADSIYSGDTFELSFLKDIANAKHSIVIACPKVRLYRHPVIAQRLLCQQAKGVEILVFIRQDNADEHKLIEQGVPVIKKETLSLQCCIIDKFLYWYGDVNFLGYHSSENNVMRMEDAMVAGELLDVIYDTRD
jgi:superfamily II DNA or RNA helicase